MAKQPSPSKERSERSQVREKPQQIADELRSLIVAGDLDEGESLGHEPDLIERFGVSRPTLREALRILEAEGLITVVRGVNGGVIAHRPDQRLTARTVALVLQSRNVPLADVFEARHDHRAGGGSDHRLGAGSSGRGASVAELIAEQERLIDDPEAFGPANARFHEELVMAAGNTTLTIVAEMLNEVVARAVTAVSRTDGDGTSARTRRRGVRSQERLAALIDDGDADAAEAHWRTHMGVVGRVMLGQQAKTVVDLMDHF